MSDVYAGRRPKYSSIKKVRVWGKGQFTIPAEIRDRLGIGEDTFLEVFHAGKAIIATPEKLNVKELAGSVQKEINQKGINIEELLTELREGAHEYESD
ncbi:MAG TPA: AbrB/MazE/SpoVT family DNA-binding domain-containing protein [Bacillota bacterium]|nr:AbrB/MazE/SpoVT family DNA-binding domain-containing protein [Bacillota bacterium]